MSHDVIPDLNTAIANAAEMFYERRLLCERRVEEALAATQTAYGQTAFGDAQYIHAAKLAADEARGWAMFEGAARDGHLLRTQSGTVSDLYPCMDEFKAVYAAAQSAGRVRTLKSAEAEDMYLNGTAYQDQTEIG